MRGGGRYRPRKSELWALRGGRPCRVRDEKCVESIRRREWQWLDEQLDRPFPLPWLPLDWADAEPEEDRVQTIRADALQQMDHYL